MDLFDEEALLGRGGEGGGGEGVVAYLPQKGKLYYDKIQDLF